MIDGFLETVAKRALLPSQSGNWIFVWNASEWIKTVFFLFEPSSLCSSHLSKQTHLQLYTLTHPVWGMRRNWKKKENVIQGQTSARVSLRHDSLLVVSDHTLYSCIIWCIWAPVDSLWCIVDSYLTKKKTARWTLPAHHTGDTGACWWLHVRLCEAVQMLLAHILKLLILVTIPNWQMCIFCSSVRRLLFFFIYKFTQIWISCIVNVCSWASIPPLTLGNDVLPPWGTWSPLSPLLHYSPRQYHFSPSLSTNKTQVVFPRPQQWN